MGGLKEKYDLITKAGMIAFQWKDIVTFFFDDLFGKRLLATHSIDGNDCILQFELFDQFRDSRYLIGFLAGFDLPEHNTVFNSPGADHVNSAFSHSFVVGCSESFAVNGYLAD